MKRFLILSITLIAMILVYSCNNENSGDVNSANTDTQEMQYSSVTEAAKAGVKYVEIENPYKSKSPKHSVILDAEFTYYDDRDEFNSTCNDLTLEDFEEGIMADGEGSGIPRPLNSSTDNDYFSPGDIQSGLEVTSIGPNRGGLELGLQGNGWYGSTSKYVVANYFVDYLSIKFTNGDVTSVCFDVFSLFDSENLTVEIYGTGGWMATTSAYGNNTGTFWGVISDMVITEIRLISTNDNAEGVDNIAFGQCECDIDVDIDIKPGSDPNSINCNNANGVIPVAILSTADFDATTVDHTTVEFEGASESHIDRRTEVARRHEEDVNGDGMTDLVLHFKKGDTDLDCNSVTGELTGMTYDGCNILGSDAVRMID